MTVAPDMPTAVKLPTVVIPVFNAFDCLVECLASLDRYSPTAHVVLVDDGSDDGRIAGHIAAWAEARGNVDLHIMRRNRGFVHAANRGVAAAEGDIVLLNTDTIVTEGWLEALGRCLASDPAIATATPWSNNAEITSLPEFCSNNPIPKDPDRWARAARESAEGSFPDLPTGVGFCMAVSGDAVQTLGFFDEDVFGRGYGEENDFCRRAANAGWRNVLCDDAYVVHRGGQSFGPLGLAPGEETMARLLAKHPGYLELVSAWIEADPLADRRQRLLEQLASMPSVKLQAP